MLYVRLAAKQLAIVALIALANVGASALIVEVAGAGKVIDWSKAIGFLSVGLAAWGAMIAKLPDISKTDFLPDWEQHELNNAVTRLKQQIWGCFYFTLGTGALGVFAGVFSGSAVQDTVAILVLFFTLMTFSIFGFFPVFWGRITSATRYLAVREKQEKERAAEVEVLTKALQSQFQTNTHSDGYWTEVE
ncbi:MAG: hypothetical protein EPO47_07780 [Rugosibacter sp.]|nr:MAG: hypothetical protein EPO60_09935 [Rugosibacter sp.]TBR08823.1 MAG: hypothetical protein EPO47_07780 [Rugosibacter sp.]